jgi:3-oxoacyl-[acyl-carrier protein] reductase
MGVTHARNPGRAPPRRRDAAHTPLRPTSARARGSFRLVDLGLNGRTAIVCGASSGLGLASAEALAGEGANVAMFARRRDLLEREAERLGALAVRGDVASATDLERLVARTVEAFGGIDIVVWNSGGPRPGTAVEASDAELEDAFAHLLLPAVRLVRLALPHLEQSRAGRVICVTSGAVKEPAPNLALTNALRPGLTGWAKTLSRELGPKGITVNCVAPGKINTPRMQELYGPDGPPADAVADIPLRRIGEPREFGDVVCFLASDRAAYVSGVTVAVDGGAARGLL